MKNKVKIAENIIKDWKKDDYVFGLNCLNRVGLLAREIGSNTLISIGDYDWTKPIFNEINKSFTDNNINIVKRVGDSRPNAPTEDLYILQDEIEKIKPDFITVVGGGSNIDLAKAASILASLSEGNHDIEQFFGVNKVSERIRKSKRKFIPVLAIQTVSSSGAHLTKYSNITDLSKSQKKLIVDDAIVPRKALFDYSITRTASTELTIDGALDGFSHLIEVFIGSQQVNIDKIERIADIGIDIIVKTLPRILKKPQDLELRKLLGLATDLGGYAIMIGGTSGPHLNSFSLVDIVSHGRASALLNPYYILFFASKLERQLEVLAKIFKKYISPNISKYKSVDREYGIAVTKGILNFYREIGFPLKLLDIKNFSDNYIKKMLVAAKDPQLEMKLKNMPIPMHIGNINQYMGMILEAAKTGNLEVIKEVS